MHKIIIIAGITVFVILMTLFALYDLQISQNLVNQSSVFGKFFADYGELPNFVIAALCIAILLEHTRFSKIKNIIFKLLMLIFLILICVFGLRNFLYFIDDDSIWSYIISLAFVPLAMISTKMIKVENNSMLIKVAFIGIIVFLGSGVLIQLLKFSWGRVRFRDLKDNLEYYSPWYVPKFNEFSDYIDSRLSFPSGHSASSVGISILTLLPYIFRKLNKKIIKIILFLIAAIWILCVAFSRVLVGAHYASDVTMGTFIAFSLYVLARHFIKLQNNLPPINQ